MKGIIIHKGKYGATQQYAEWLAEELELPIVSPDEIHSEKLHLFDFVIVAGSIYIGKWTMREWVKDHLSFLQSKKLFFMFVCGTPVSMKNELEKMAKSNIPEQIYPGAEIFFLPGRLIIDKLSWKDRFVLKMGARLEKNPATRQRMLTDVDGVAKENLNDVKTRIRSYQFSKHASSRVWREPVTPLN